MTMEFKPVNELSYKEAMSQLEALLSEMQSENCDIDRLAAYTRRATELITECRRRLTATDEELRTILAQLDN